MWSPCRASLSYRWNMTIWSRCQRYRVAFGRTRESVRLLAAGERGGGDFPAPVSHLRSRNRLWRWSDVAAWAGVRGDQDSENAQLLAAMNTALELRNRSATLPPNERERVEALAR